MDNEGQPSQKKAKETNPMHVAFAIDIESRGDSLLRHGILSIGVCVGRLDREEVIHRQRFDLKPLKYFDYNDIIGMTTYDHHREPYIMLEDATPRIQKFEQRCLDEFWYDEEKCPGGREKLQLMQRGAIDPIEGIIQFRELLDRFDDGVNYEAKIISDNVIFDAGWINHYLDLAGRYNLSHTSQGCYRRIFDTVDYRRGACHMDYEDVWMNERAIIDYFGLTVNPDDHTHMPEDDAEYIYRFHVQLVNKVRQYPPVAINEEEGEDEKE